MHGGLIKKSDGKLAENVQSGLPAVVMVAGKRAALRFIEFFAAEIRNPNSRRAYYRAVCDFFIWCETVGWRLSGAVRCTWPPISSVYGRTLSSPSAKQRLAAIRMVFDYLVLGQAIPTNPVTALRGPKYSTKRGRTPVLSADEARQLLDSIDTSNVVGLRDRALIALMVFTFARVGAAVGMNVEDWYFQNRRWWVRLHEKGSKQHEMSAHHSLEECMVAYIEAAVLSEEKHTPLFRTARGKTKRLTEHRMSQPEVYLIIRRRAAGAGIKTLIGCHTFRATGITAYLKQQSGRNNFCGIR
jgi:site-specific recombinase XerC